MLDTERIQKELRSPSAGVLHRRLRAAIQDQILDGTIQPGEALPAERAMQEALGISRTTVRQAIQGLIESGLVRSTVGAGTFVLSPNSSPVERNLVGVLLPDANFHVYYTELASTLSFHLRAAGYGVDLTIHNVHTESMGAAIDRLIDQRVAAVIITAPSQSGEFAANIRRLRENGIYVMLLTRFVESEFNLDYVGADNERIGYQATQHLLQLGHTRIVHIAAKGTSTALDRARGYLRAMDEHNLSPQIYSPPNEPGVLSTEMAALSMGEDVEVLLNRIQRHDVTAIFSFNDYLAIWLQGELRGRGMQAPRDISIVSVDNLPISTFFETPLSSFALPGAEIGSTAASIVLRRLRGEQFPPQKVLLPGKLVARQSAAALPELQYQIG